MTLYYKEMQFSSASLIPEMSRLLLIDSAKGSMSSVNSSGDKEHTCLQPLRTKNLSDSRPFVLCCEKILMNKM